MDTSHFLSPNFIDATVVEQADTTDLKSVAFSCVGVQVPSVAPVVRSLLTDVRDYRLTSRRMIMLAEN